MSSEKKSRKKMLRRYTNLPSLLCMLTKKQLTLLDPATWDDRNDSYYLDLYTKKKKLQRTLALCLSQKNETYHHWRVFTSKENGVCIFFDREKLEAHLNKQENIMHGSVNYKTLNKIQKDSSEALDVDDMPFLKRHAFADESEYRIIYPSSRNVNFKHIEMPLTIIEKILINPWAPVAFCDVIEETIKNIRGCEKIKVIKSSLIENKKWRSIGEEVCNNQRA